MQRITVTKGKDGFGFKLTGMRLPLCLHPTKDGPQQTLPAGHASSSSCRFGHHDQGGPAEAAGVVEGMHLMGIEEHPTLDGSLAAVIKAVQNCTTELVLLCQPNPSKASTTTTTAPTLAQDAPAAASLNGSAEPSAAGDRGWDCDSTSQHGSRHGKLNQDVPFCASFKQNGHRIAIAAVFDGHGLLGEIAAAMARDTMTALQPTFAWDSLLTQPEQGMREIFAQLDAAIVAAHDAPPAQYTYIGQSGSLDFRLEAHAIPELDPPSGYVCTSRDGVPPRPIDFGCTAVVAVVVDETHVVVGNAGDAAAFVLLRDQAGHEDRDGYSVEALSVQHTARSKAEQARVHETHPGAAHFTGDGYLAPLDPTLAQYELQLTRSLGHRLLKRAGVIADPEVRSQTWPVGEVHGVVACSDGITDELSGLDVLDRVLNAGTALEASEVLCQDAQDYCMDETCIDDATAVVALLRPLADLPAPTPDVPPAPVTPVTKPAVTAPKPVITAPKPTISAPKPVVAAVKTASEPPAAVASRPSLPRKPTILRKKVEKTLTRVRSYSTHGSRHGKLNQDVPFCASFKQNGHRIAIASVFDGHGLLGEIAAAMARDTMTALQPTFAWDSLLTQPEQGMREIFAQLDAAIVAAHDAPPAQYTYIGQSGSLDFRLEAHAIPELDPPSGYVCTSRDGVPPRPIDFGCTAVVAVVVDETHVVAGNAGDAAAFVLLRDQAGHEDRDGYSVEALSVQHTARSKAEQARVHETHPGAAHFTGDGYLAPLDPTLAQYELQLTRSLGHRLLKRAGVIADPEVRSQTWPVGEVHGVVACSDGITDELSGLDVLDRVLNAGTALEASEVLCQDAQDYCMDETCIDDATAVVALFPARDTISEKLEAIEVAVVAVGSNHARRLQVLIKSILFHHLPPQPLRFHVITDHETAASLRHLYRSWRLPAVQVRFYSITAALQGVDLHGLETHHYAGRYAFVKLFVADLLPVSLERVMVLDTDLLFLGPIAELWDQFKGWSASAIFAVVDNFSEWYIPGRLQRQPWPAPAPLGINTGVTLLHLARLRHQNFPKVWTSAVARVLADPRLNITYAPLADQDVMNTVFYDNPTLLHRLPCRFNYQLSENTLIFQ
ncbi:uncharacterized protein MONBRDRAFT_25622, partial [Monosiga brevicollis MX1]